MAGFEPLNADFEARTRDSFARQGIMATLGAELTRVEPGLVEIVLPFRPALSQQHGFFHAGVTATPPSRCFRRRRRC
jgi:acyl-coenzyme A thioesterase PaaI-like protein